jgi:hypothetical protein
MGKYFSRSSFPRSSNGIAVALGSELTTSRNMVPSVIFRSTTTPESIIRKVLWQTLLALRHLHTAVEDRPVVVYCALSPEKRK